MNDEADHLAASLRKLASEARQREGPGAHPSPEKLTAYHAGELTVAFEEEIQEHLAVCRHCTRLLLDLPAFLAAPDTGLEGGEAGGTILLLNLAHEQPNLRFLVELRSAESSATGARSRTLTVADVVSSRTLLLTLARHELTPGAYRLLVLDAEHPSAAPLGDYPLQVVEP